MMSELLSPREVAALWDLFMEEHFPISTREAQANPEELALLLELGKERLLGRANAESVDSTNDLYAAKYRQYTKGVESGEEPMKTNNLWNLFNADRQSNLDRIFIDARPDPQGEYRNYGESQGRDFNEEVNQSLWEPQFYYLQKKGLLKKMFERLGLRESEEFLALQAAVANPSAKSQDEMADIYKKHEVYLEKIYVIFAEMGINMSSLDG